MNEENGRGRRVKEAETVEQEFRKNDKDDGRKSLEKDEERKGNLS